MLGAGMAACWAETVLAKLHSQSGAWFSLSRLRFVFSVQLSPPPPSFGLVLLVFFFLW